MRIKQNVWIIHTSKSMESYNLWIMIVWIIRDVQINEGQIIRAILYMCIRSFHHSTSVNHKIWIRLFLPRKHKQLFQQKALLDFSWSLSLAWNWPSPSGWNGSSRKFINLDLDEVHAEVSPEDDQTNRSGLSYPVRVSRAYLIHWSSIKIPSSV